MLSCFAFQVQSIEDVWYRKVSTVDVNLNIVWNVTFLFCILTCEEKVRTFNDEIFKGRLPLLSCYPFLCMLWLAFLKMIRIQRDFSPAVAWDWVCLNLCLFSYSDEAPAAPTGGMDINTALQEVLKMALTHGSLAHGLHEAAKALDK